MSHPLNLSLSEEAKAGYLKAHGGILNGGYFDAMENLLDRAKHMASGLGSAADVCDFSNHPIAANETAALAFTIAEKIEAAQALLKGLYRDLEAAHNGDTGRRP